MKKLTSLLTIFLTCSLLAAPLRAQQPSATINELKEQIARLEAVDAEPGTSTEIRELNMKFLFERRSELGTLLRKRIVALRAYQANVGSVLKPEEKQLIDASIRDLERDLQSLSMGARQSVALPTASSSPVKPEIAPERFVAAGYNDKKRESARLDNASFAALPDLSGGASVKNSVTPGSARADVPPVPQPSPPKDTGDDSYNKEADVKVDVASEQVTGNKVRGPASVLLTNVNILRYDVRVGQDVTFPAAPDLNKLPFIPPVPTKTPGTTTSTTPSTESTGQPTFDNTLASIITELGKTETYVEHNVNQPLAKVDDAKAEVEALVTASDSMLASAGPNSSAGAKAIINRLGDPVIPAVKDAVNQQFPGTEIQDAIDSLNKLETGLTSLPSVKDPSYTWEQWYTGDRKISYDNTTARVRELRSALRNIDRNDFRELQRKLNTWLSILESVQTAGVDGFTRYVDVRCGFAFETGKETKVKITKRDRLADATATPATEEIVTVVCSSPLSISGGFGFSFINERNIGFVQSTKEVTANGQTTQQVINRFGFTSNSSFHTVPVLLLNTRVWEPDDLFALHASAGAVVDVKSGEAGTDIEFVVGPSLSFWRTLFVTPGLHIGRVQKLAGGFNIGDEVPSGVNAPPLEKAWKTGFMTAFTYKIK